MSVRYIAYILSSSIDFETYKEKLEKQACCSGDNGDDGGMAVSIPLQEYKMLQSKATKLER